MITNLSKEPNATFFYTKRFFGAILLLALAAVFFFSAYSKLVAIEAFEWTFIDIGFPGTVSASIAARIFIGLEFVIGAFLAFHIYLKQVTYPITIGMLLLLTAYLIILIIQQGNTGNCGCFGDWIYMNPLQAIWKNLAMIAVVILLRFIYPVKPYKNQEWIGATLAMAALVTSFIIAPLNVNNLPKPVDKSIDMSILYSPMQKPQPAVDLRKGKHIIAFMSLTCPHCKKAAYMLHVIKKKHPGMPIYMVLSGHDDQQAKFFKETHADDVPYVLCTDMQGFIGMAGDSVPAIYWVNNSYIEKESNYMQLDPVYIENWLNN